MEGNDDLLDYSQKNFLPSWEDKSILRLAVREIENLISHTFDGGYEYKLQLYGSAMSGLNLKGVGDADLDFSLSFPSANISPESVFKQIKEAL
jgi:tRNA nucleotidyltransferase (CCA-adding enzyme)